MDAKSKADFINSVGAGTVIPCPKCGTVNESDSKFCMSCGTNLSAPQTPQTDGPAFAPIEEKKTPVQVEERETPMQVKEKETPVQAEKRETPMQAEEKAAPVQILKYVEPSNAFAEGLPEWSIEPPQVMVRRH